MSTISWIEDANASSNKINKNHNITTFKLVLFELLSLDFKPFMLFDASVSHFSDFKFCAVDRIPATWRLKRAKWELVTVIDRKKKKTQVPRL